MPQQVNIDKRVNLVLEVERDDGSVVHVHSVPIGRNVFESNYMFISKAMGEMYGDLSNPAGAMRIAYIHMKSMIERDKPRWDNVTASLFSEIWRLTNVMMPGERGWETIPFYDVMQQKLLSDDDISEVQNFICFFTAASWVHSRRERKGMAFLMENSGGQLTSLDSTEYRNSLPTLKADGSSGVMATASSIPS